MKILVTGANGQLGCSIQNISELYDISLILTDSEQLDITILESVDKIIEEARPDIIVNAAAYTAVDKAEEEEALATKVNVTGPHNLAVIADRYEIPLIHVSTDYVFDGSETKPYHPYDKSNPQGIYGKTKWMGEEAVRNNLTQHVIVRTAWVFSEYGNNFVKTILNLSTSREELGIIADQYGCPTYAGDLAKCILDIAIKINSCESIEWGTYHYCGDMATSWHGFTRAIVADARDFGIIKDLPVINAIKSSDYTFKTPRPEFSVLDCSATEESWGVKPSNWRNSLVRVIEKLSSQ
ncbi:dTDP-4-dehydrorhamnose reductase [Vibrio furnissii]|uniref:dTDP-4-dehydrorhamnose reductase n=1 Tax=Vibrio furnissii TaxID=29494 RepID=UPI0025730831|nr:dTDP-4-dehydrorhamnose reductase [Vibrio furnissii]WJG21764.1 dTDP-4-dehydrorhamnose reductase [Vibrio furnissii]